MKRNKILPLLLALSALTLSGCKEDAQEVYDANAYDTGDFVQNYYTGKHDISVTTPSVSEKTLANDDFYCGFQENDFNQGGYTHKGVKTMVPELMKDDQGNALTSTLDWTPANLANDEDFVGKAFGRTLCLAKIDSAFTTGILSKLYNGQMYCDLWYAKARVQIDKDGYDAFFPKRVKSADQFLFSVRGATDLASGVTDRIITVDMKASFFFDKGDGSYQQLDFLLPKVGMTCDAGGESTSFVGFSLGKLLPNGYSVSKIVGMGLSFSNLADSADGDKLSITADDGAANHFALMLYEVMLPHSTWD
jgi:hypothetical protein